MCKWCVCGVSLCTNFFVDDVVVFVVLFSNYVVDVFRVFCVVFFLGEGLSPSKIDNHQRSKGSVLRMV